MHVGTVKSASNLVHRDGHGNLLRCSIRALIFTTALVKWFHQFNIDLLILGVVATTLTITHGHHAYHLVDISPWPYLAWQELVARITNVTPSLLGLAGWWPPVSDLKFLSVIDVTTHDEGTETCVFRLDCQADFSVPIDRFTICNYDIVHDLLIFLA